MLTADLVGARRRGDELRLPPTDDARRARVAALAAALTARARDEVGRPRDEVDEALRETITALEAEEAAQGAQRSKVGSDRRLSAAVGKLVRDGLRFEESPSRRRGRAAARALPRRGGRPARRAHRALQSGGFARELRGRAADDGGRAGERRSTPTARARSASWRSRRRPPRCWRPASRSPRRRRCLLRATKVVAEIEARDAARLPPAVPHAQVPAPPAGHRAPAGKRGGYRVEMDGPLSLFQSAGRYGLSLALALPAIAACDVWAIDADVRWGADRRPLRFRLARRAPRSIRRAGAAGRGGARRHARPTSWRRSSLRSSAPKAAGASTRPPRSSISPAPASASPTWLRAGAAMGRASSSSCSASGAARRSVRRIDLVRAGLPHKILFAASKSLRVGEALLDDAPGRRSTSSPACSTSARSSRAWTAWRTVTAIVTAPTLTFPGANH